MIGREGEDCCKTTPSDFDNSSKSLNVSQSAGFIEDPNGREIISSSAEGTGKEDTDGGFIGVGELKALGMHCGFYVVSKVLICASGGVG